MNKDRKADAVFFALSDPTRRDVMKHLNERGAQSASDLATTMPVSRQAIAKHLQALADAGLVRSQREGRELMYHLTPEPMTAAMSWMADVGARWDDRLGKLRHYLGEG